MTLLFSRWRLNFRIWLIIVFQMSFDIIVFSGTYESVSTFIPFSLWLLATLIFRGQWAQCLGLCDFQTAPFWLRATPKPFITNISTRILICFNIPVSSLVNEKCRNKIINLVKVWVVFETSYVSFRCDFSFLSATHC